MRLIEIENKIKELVEVGNFENPELYQTIYDLVYFYFKRRKLLTYQQDFEEVSHLGATDLLLKVYNGNKINSWIGYLNVAYHGYIREYRKKYRSEIIDTNNNIPLRNAIYMMSASSAFQPMANYESVIVKEYINDIIDTIDEVMNMSKYFEYTKAYYNTELTLLLSILNEQFLPYNRMTEDEELYARMLYVKLMDKIIANIGYGTFNQDNVLTQYTLEMLQINEESGDNYNYEY